MAEHKDSGIKRPAPDDIPELKLADKLVENHAEKVTELKKKRIETSSKISNLIHVIGLAQEALCAINAKRFDTASDICEMTLKLKTLIDYDKSLDREVDDRMALIRDSIEDTAGLVARTRKRRRA